MDRQIVSYCLGTADDSKKSKVQSMGLAKPIIERLLAIGCEDDPEDVDEDSPSRVSDRLS